MDFRPWDAEVVGVLPGWHHLAQRLVGVVLHLFYQEAHAELAGEEAVEFLHQRRAEQRLGRLATL
ncbi:hypothetical protein D9M69_641400 [compost metagenome]